MKIKKLAHCCLVIDIGKTRILLDPGSYSIEEHDKIDHADIILITHEHQDHFHLDSVKALVNRSPSVTVITDVGVGAILTKEGIEHRVMEHGNSIDVKGVHIEAFGKDHKPLHSSLPLMSNIGFFIENKLFFPGDAFTMPGKAVDALALPVAGPWLNIGEAIDYALEVKPRMAFPVHDGASGSAAMYRIPETILGKNGIEFIKLENGGEMEVK